MTKALLEATALSAGYNGQAVVRHVDIKVNAGEMVCLLGPNGAGKTTTLQTLAGDLMKIDGHVSFMGQTDTAPLHQRVRQGLAYITDQRTIVMGLSVLDNLRLRGGDVSAATTAFPELVPLLNRPAAELSGGQQQILAVARALASKPTLLIADELSMGLAPQVVDRLLTSLRQATQHGLGVLLVEQHIDKALKHSDRAYVMAQGSIALSGTAASLLQDRSAIEAAYINH